MASLTALDKEIIQQQIDAYTTEIARYEESIKGKAENRSNSVDWYQDAISERRELIEQLKSQLESGVKPDAGDLTELSSRVNVLETQAADSNKDVADLVGRIKNLESKVFPQA